MCTQGALVPMNCEAWKIFRPSKSLSTDPISAAVNPSSRMMLMGAAEVPLCVRELGRRQFMTQGMQLGPKWHKLENDCREVEPQGI
jgi:hypothetical protein